MLASGGLSGGLSSSIAGGKFVDGFRQGIITTGLNHLAIHVVNGNHQFDREITKHYGMMKADMEAPPTEESVKSVLGLPSIKMWSAYDFTFEVDPNNYYWPENGDSEAITLPNSYEKAASSKVTFYKASFSSYRHLAHTVIHEIGHVIYNRLGFFAHNIKNYGYNDAVKASEYYAYTFSAKYAGDTVDRIVDYARGKSFVSGKPLENFGNGWYIKY